MTARCLIPQRLEPVGCSERLSGCWGSRRRRPREAPQRRAAAGGFSALVHALGDLSRRADAEARLRSGRFCAPPRWRAPLERHPWSYADHLSMRAFPPHRQPHAGRSPHRSASRLRQPSTDRGRLRRPDIGRASTAFPGTASPNPAFLAPPERAVLAHYRLDWPIRSARWPRVRGAHPRPYH